MADIVRMYDLAPSPNNMKVRIALNYKEIPFQRIPVDPEDRSEVIKVSRQPLTPVIAHGDRIIFDSASILRYIEANFPQSRPLFSTDYETMNEIEDWEFFGRRELVDPVGTTFGQFFQEKRDSKVLEAASSRLHEHTARIEERLAGAEWLVGKNMTAADVTAVPVIFYGMVPDAVAATHPIAKFFADNLKLGEGRDRTRAWVTRVMAYDR